MSRKKHKKLARSAPESQPASEPTRLIGTRDVLGLGLAVTVLVTTIELVSPDAKISDAQIVGLFVVSTLSLIVSRMLWNLVRGLRAK